MGTLGRIVYWLAVLVVSVALVIALIVFLESRDDSSLEGAGAQPPATLAASLR